jgi:hypothetical protein
VVGQESDDFGSLVFRVVVAFLVAPLAAALTSVSALALSVCGVSAFGDSAFGASVLPLADGVSALAAASVPGLVSGFVSGLVSGRDAVPVGAEL